MLCWAMRQRKLGSHTPPRHRRMVRCCVGEMRGWVVYEGIRGFEFYLLGEGLPHSL